MSRPLFQTISFRVRDWEFEAISKGAERRHLSNSALIRRAISAYLNPEPAKPTIEVQTGTQHGSLTTVITTS
jgi:Ribbon-helix-helix protein, copG family